MAATHLTSVGAAAAEDDVYRGHELKIAANAARRTKPFDEAVMSGISGVDGLIDVLAGEMLIPGVLEAQLLMTLASAVQQQGGQGVRLHDEPWMLLDLVLVARHSDPNVPLALVAEVMLKSQVVKTSIDGQVVQLTELFEAEYDQWSVNPDPDVCAGNHFKYGYSLLITNGDEAVGRALDQFAVAAKHPQHIANASDIIAKVLQAAPGHKVVSDASGLTYEMDAAGKKVLVGGKPIGEIMPASSPAGAAAAAGSGAGATASNNAHDGGDNSTVLLAVAVGAIAVTTIVAWAFFKSKKQ